MKILHLIIFTLVAITVMSCLNESTTCDECDNYNDDSDNYNEYNDFFPLKVGDSFVYQLSPESYLSPWWIYVLGPYVPEYITAQVTRKVEKFGKIYYEIKTVNSDNRIHYFGFNDFNDTTIYARTDKNNVYLFVEDAEGKEIRFYRFNNPLDSLYYAPYFPFYYRYSSNPPIKIIEKSQDQILFAHFLYPISYYDTYAGRLTRFEKDKGLVQWILVELDGHNYADTVTKIIYDRVR